MDLMQFISFITVITVSQKLALKSAYFPNIPYLTLLYLRGGGVRVLGRLWYNGLIHIPDKLNLLQVEESGIILWMTKCSEE